MYASRSIKLNLFQVCVFVLSLFWLSACSPTAKEIFVAPTGSDDNNGSGNAPFASFERALLETKEFAGKQAMYVWFEAGTYYLSNTLVLNEEYSGTTDKPIVFSALGN